jgi:hypothetical protein
MGMARWRELVDEFAGSSSGAPSPTTRLERKFMSSVQDVSAASARSLAQAYEQLAASRRDAARETQNQAKNRTTPAEEAAESPAERVAETGADGTGQIVNTVA